MDASETGDLVALATAGPTPSLILLVVIGMLFLSSICLASAFEYKKKTKQMELSRRHRRVNQKLQRISDEIKLANIVEYHRENDEAEK